MITSASRFDAPPKASSAAATGGPVLPLRRVARFSAVGAFGFVFQMGLAWALVGLWHVDPVWAWVASTEAAVLHNFVWHVHWTWADRPAPAVPTLARLARFNLSNGAISIVGGAFVTRVLTVDLGVPVLIAFVASVMLCSLANLLAGEYWAFQAV